ncbi:hypothetical protein BDV38DRAFT_286680 [Aspergillus pseudotamarii]|uniref:CAP domain-containing protein n=1 Tax=Aspergillus pseudotamarii TaxID=132259 RepID=A0A5N6SIC0_ASPPS|nr:uncharacterized protein BDV38DRAFT_286680 [Aspergillus pseudotamarii]KAE8133639.1 hypothetical protein BDV38DRAFT_286680 [Aspergillus pseudotamarii]
MKYTGLIAVLLACSVAAGPVESSSQGPPGYGVEDLEWSVQLTESGEPINVKGTVEDVVAELSKQNPSAEEQIRARGKAKQSLMKRADPTGYYCGEPFTPVPSASISQGIEYLQGVPGKPVNGPGPGNCGRVSCSYNAAIWWCNDNTESKTLDSFAEIANGAEKLLHWCYHWEEGTLGSYVGGQAFYADNWNVIVRKNDC